ncbi:V-type ATP synthase subunit E [Anaerosphaera multitolerans]|nr:V-type ATP synthase subunit E [Anaerosphaera multitolerans]
MDNIINKIETDAQNEAQELLKNTRDKAQQIIDAKVREANLGAKRILERKKLEAVETEERIFSQVDLQNRDMVLSAKGDIVDRVFDIALTKLTNLPEEDYINYLKRVLATMELKEDCILTVPEKYYEAVKKENLNVKLSNEFVSDGFTVSMDSVLYNNKFTSLIDDIRADMEREVFDRVFDN